MPAVNSSARLLYLSYTPDLSTMVAGIFPEFLTSILNRTERGGKQPWTCKGRCRKQCLSFLVVKNESLGLSLQGRY